LLGLLGVEYLNGSDPLNTDCPKRVLRSIKDRLLFCKEECKKNGAPVAVV